MLFQLNFGKRYRLRGAVLEHIDPKPLWGALSLAKFLKCRFPHEFSRQHSIGRLKHVVGLREAEIYSWQLMDTRLMSHYDVLISLGRSPLKRAKVLHNRLFDGRFYVREKKKNRFFPILEMCSPFDPNAIEFDRWISLIKMQLGNEDIRTTLNTTTADASIADDGTADTSTADASIADDGTADTSTADASIADDGTADTSTADASIADDGTADTSTADDGTADTSIADDGTADTSTADDGTGSLFHYTPATPPRPYRPCLRNILNLI